MIPADGEIIDGVASVDESAITGESAPVIRESGGDRSAVTGGTKVLSDWIRVQVTANPGETFLDRMIALVEGAERQKTPNEIALNILLAGLTIVFLIAVVTLQPFAIYSGAPQSALRPGVAAGVPHPDDHRRPAVGDRHRRHGSPGAAQRAGDVRPRGRSRRRRPYAAPGQDRHHHARQPARDRVHSAARGEHRGTRRRRPAGLAAGRDTGGPFDRRAGEGEVRPARARAVAAARDVRAVHRADADVGRESARAAAGTGDVDRVVGRPERRRPRDPEGVCRRRREMDCLEGRQRARRPVRDRAARRPCRRHAARRGRRAAGPRRHPPEGHRQGRDQGAVRAPAERWGSRPS